MRFDPARLLNWAVPDRSQVLARKDAAFYALSVGCAHDQTDMRCRRFVDPTAEDFDTLPSMAFVMAYPGFWLGDPALGLDALRVVHAEQSIEIVRALPVEGLVSSRTRITDLVDGGEGRAAFLYTERDLLDGDGRMLARLRQTHILRGAGGFGGGNARPPVPEPVPETGPAHVVEIATRPEQALLYRLNGDLNPIHSDPTASRRAGFPRPLLHGMCTFGIVTQALVRALCDWEPARLRAMSLRFTGPVYPGETIRVEMFPNGAFRARVVERDSVVADFGEARVETWAGPVEAKRYAV